MSISALPSEAKPKALQIQQVTESPESAQHSGVFPCKLAAGLQSAGHVSLVTLVLNVFRVRYLTLTNLIQAVAVLEGSIAVAAADVGLCSRAGAAVSSSSSSSGGGSGSGGGGGGGGGSGSGSRSGGGGSGSGSRRRP